MQLVLERNDRCGEQWCSLGHCHLGLLPLALHNKDSQREVLQHQAGHFEGMTYAMNLLLT